MELNTFKWLILMTTPPYSHPLFDSEIKKIELLVLTSKEIILFYYLDGIHLVNSDQYPKNLINIGEYFVKLHKDFPFIRFLACSRCTAARGYVDLSKSDLENNIFRSFKLYKFVQIVSIREFGKLLNQGYRLVQL